MTADQLRVGIIAPPWVPVPPPAYGGTEVVLDALARGLASRGHEVVLFATGDSTCQVERAWLYDEADFDRAGTAVELCHSTAAYRALADCDLIHDHTLAGLFLRHLHADLPVVTTIHGLFNDDLKRLFRHTAATIPLIAISRDQARRAPEDVAVTSVIHHGLDLNRYPFRAEGGDYLLCLGRMHPDKGIDRAVHVARRAERELKIAAKMREPVERQFFDNVVRPLLGAGVEYVGEVSHDEKVDLLGGAAALLNPIRWTEPFGLVMIEAMACGAPVIATPRGAAPEIVAHGTTGFLASDDADLVAAVNAIDRIARTNCREHVESRFTMERMARHHENLYQRARNRRLIPTVT
jgi:glycosyltransferase involved in cell wall biosynthesis